MFKKIFESKKAKTVFSYGFSFLIVASFAIFLIQSTKLSDFLMSIENKTFDVRQNLLVNSHYKKPNKNIVLIVVDDSSYEYLLNKYGEWPPPRDMYAKLINYLEKQKPAVIAFDLMFIKSMKSKSNADAQLVNEIKNNTNVFTAMNFDDAPSDVRKPIFL